MKILIGATVGLVIGMLTGGLVAAKVMSDCLEQKFVSNGHASDSVLPTYAVSVNGLPPQEVTTNGTTRVGYGTRLGGEPEWIQGAEIPVCRECQRPMVFVAQIDSIAMADERKHCGRGPGGKEIVEFMFGDAGMVYVFTCLDCGEVAGVGQCY